MLLAMLASVRDRQRGIRQVAVFFALGGLFSFIANRVPGTPHAGLAADLIALADVLVAVLAWFAPWDRWPDRATLLLVGFALALIGMPTYLGMAPSYSYSACFVVVFVWVGMTQPPFTSLWVAPLATATYLLPLLTGPGDHADAIPSATVALPICILVAEIVARTVAQLDAAQAESERQAALLGVLAERDELTGLGNRRHASAILATIQTGDVLMMIDLDHFKAVNDNSGHAAGDDVLRELGAFLRGALRDADLVRATAARSSSSSSVPPGRTRRSSPDGCCKGWRARRPRTTWSGGLATHEEATTSAVTLTRADFALYEAKRRGRNTVCNYQALHQLYDVGIAI